MSGPREYTVDECRKIIIDKIKACIHECENETRRPTVREKLELLAFTILAELDGCGMSFPALQLLTAPHPDDKRYHEVRDENWWPTGLDVGPLHEFFSQVTNPTPANRRAGERGR